jgi:hypothetical protein
MAIKAGETCLMFKCDRCPNEVEFYHGMPTFRISNEKGSYCSEICVREVIKSRGQNPFNLEGMPRSE